MYNIPRRHLISRVTRGVATAALAAIGLLSACGSNHVGRPCEVGTTPVPASSGQVVTVASPALECPSRICLLPGGAVPQGTSALCTAPCESDADCDTDEIGRKNDPADGRCENGFACAWPTTVGAFACKKMCVCRDFVSEPSGGFTKPAACP